MKRLPAQGVVVITETAPAWGPPVVAAVNRADEQFTRLRIRDLVSATGPYITYYEGEAGQDQPAAGRGRDVWVNVIDDVADVDQQVFETQLPVRRREE